MVVARSRSLRLHVLASGSKGNAVVVEGPEGAILVDCGVSCRSLTQRAAVERFREANGTTVCQELKAPGDDAGCVRSCAGCVEDAVRIACDVIAGREA